MAATFVVLETSPEHIAATIDASVVQLRLGDSEYASKCVALKTALVHLSDQLKEFRVSDQQDATVGIQLLVKARISASITYHVVYKLVHEPPEVYCCCCCWSAEGDPVARALDTQVNETRTLAEHLASYIQGTTATGGHGQEPRSTALDLPAFRSGVSNLTLTTPSHVDRKIADGAVLSFPVIDTNQKVIYTVKTWINNPASWFRTARRLSASLEIEQDDKSGKKEWDILLPEQKEDTSWEQTAFLSCSGSQQAVVKSVLPVDAGSDCFGNPRGHSATLLMRYHMGRRRRRRHRRTRYREQAYLIEVRPSSTAFEMGLEGGAVRTLRVTGRKEEFKVNYVCFVQETKEVLAVYLHLRRQHRGVFQFIGIGNHPVLRDFIVGAFVAMGLHSEL